MLHSEQNTWLTHVDGVQVASNVFSRLGTTQDERATVGAADRSVHVTCLSQHALVVVHGGGACKSHAQQLTNQNAATVPPQKSFIIGDANILITVLITNQKLYQGF